MPRGIYLFIGFIAVVGCGPSPAKVVQDYTPAMQNMRAKLKVIADKMPSQVQERAVAAPLDPPLVYARESDEGNTEALMWEELTGDKGDPEMNLYMSNDLSVCLAWTEQGRSAPSTGDGQYMKKSFEQATSARYLVVNRVKRLQLPRAVGETRYAPGSMVVEGVVFDLTTGEPLASYVVGAETASSVYASARKGEEPASIESAARSTMWSQVREKIAVKLAEVTGGSAQMGPSEKRHGNVQLVAAAPKVAPLPSAPNSGIQKSNPLAPEDAALAEPSGQQAASSAVPGIPLYRPKVNDYLRDLTPVTVEVHEQNEHKLIRDFHVKGTLFFHGLYCHPPAAKTPARVVYPLGQNYTRLTGAAGQSDGLPAESFTPLTFRILADGKVVWSSPPIRRHGEWVPFDVDVSSVKQLELRVDCPGDHSFAWGVWMDPILTKK